MKKILFLAPLLLLLTACIHDKVENIDLTPYTPENEEGKSGFTVLSESDCDFNKVKWNTYNFDVPDDEVQTKTTYTNMVTMATGILSGAVSTNVHQVVGTYISSDIDDNPIRVSGKIFYPRDGKIKNIILASHFTIGANFECPSESYSFEGIFAAFGYAVVLADYIGFGVSSDRVHPYLQAETCARNVIDMGIVARNFLKERGIVPDNPKVILLGYSQGGACTMHVQRMIEYGYYYKTFEIEKVFCGSGPYDIAKTYDYAVQKDYTGIPCAIPMIVQGMSLGMEKPLDMKYFFSERLYENHQEWLNSKKYTVVQISSLIGTNKLSEILTSDARDRKKEETARFYMELRENSIPITFVPAAPLYLFHSQDDDTVPFVNSQIIQRQIRNVEKTGTDYNADVEYDFGHYGNHQKGAVKFFLNVLKKLK